MFDSGLCDHQLSRPPGFFEAKILTMLSPVHWLPLVSVCWSDFGGRKDHKVTPELLRTISSPPSDIESLKFHGKNRSLQHLMVLVGLICMAFNVQRHAKKIRS